MKCPKCDLNIDDGFNQSLGIKEVGFEKSMEYLRYWNGQDWYVCNNCNSVFFIEKIKRKEAR